MISSVSRVSVMLIAYTSEMWLCCGSMKLRAHPLARLQVACFSSSYCSTKRGGSSSAAVAISGIFGIALKQPGALANLNADYGHMLLATNRSKEAELVMEQAIKDTPEAGDAWTDLGLARLRNHNPAGACLAADQADTLAHAVHAHTSTRWIWREAKCSGH